jgi:hypothetical protein
MKLLPIGKTASHTKYSSLSRNEIAKFLSTLGSKRVYPSTVTKLCKILKFQEEIPVPLSDVQLIYLVACAKELINGGSASYNEAMITFKLRPTDSNADLLEAWNAVHAMGGMTKREFDEAIVTYYAQVQHEKAKRFG